MYNTVKSKVSERDRVSGSVGRNRSLTDREPYFVKYIE